MVIQETLASPSVLNFCINCRYVVRKLESSDDNPVTTYYCKAGVYVDVDQLAAPATQNVRMCVT